jgi:predicted dehydrogenase
VVQVGVGGFGACRRERMRETGLFELAACYDLNPEAMEQCRKEDGARPVRSYRELLDTPGAEAAVIATGAKFHAAQVLAALERGLHVFVEKPLCSTPRELEALLEAQKRTGLVVGVGHDDHAHSAVSLTIKRLVDRGAFGKLASFEMTTAHSGAFLIKPGEWRGDPKKNPGGMLFQCGVHGLHELMFYFGPVARVSCVLRYDVHTTATADVANCLLELEGGLTGTLNAYHVTPYRHTLFLFGTKMNLYRDDRHFGEGTRIFTQTGGLDGGSQPLVPLDIKGKDDPCGNLRSFYKAVMEGGTPYPSLLDGARAVAVCFAAERSARTGRMLPIGKLP